MAKHLTTSEHQMLENLSGLQHTRNGKIRQKQNRSEQESKRLGIITIAQVAWQNAWNSIKWKGQK